MLTSTGPVSISKAPAITVRFMAPTKSRGARMKAMLTKQVYKVYAYDHDIDSSRNHADACDKFLFDMGITGDYIGSKDHKGTYYFVDLSKEIGNE